MSIWSFLGGFAVFNMICDLFSGKSKRNQPRFYEPQNNYIPNPEYAARLAELNREIEESEKRLAEYRKVINGSYSADGLDDYDLDELQRQIDDLDDLNDQLDDINDELDDIIDYGDDDDW